MWWKFRKGSDCAGNDSMLWRCCVGENQMFTSSRIYGEQDSVREWSEQCICSSSQVLQELHCLSYNAAGAWMGWYAQQRTLNSTHGLSKARKGNMADGNKCVRTWRPGSIGHPQTLSRIFQNVRWGEEWSNWFTSRQWFEKFLYGSESEAGVALMEVIEVFLKRMKRVGSDRALVCVALSKIPHSCILNLIRITSILSRPSSWCEG